MKNIRQIKNWLLENAVNKHGDLILSKLDFSDFEGDVYIDSMKVKGSLFQNGQRVQDCLHQEGHEVLGILKQYGHTVGGNLYQGYHKVKSDLFQSESEVLGDLSQHGHTVEGDLNQSYQEVKCNLFQDEHGVMGDLSQSDSEAEGNLFNKNNRYGGDLDESQSTKIFKEVSIEESKRWEPKIGEYYWSVAGSSIVCHLWEDDKFDRHMLATGNVFKARKDEGIQKHLKKVSFLEQMETDFEDNSDDVNWEDDDQRKYSLRFDHYENIIGVAWCYSGQNQGTLYTTNREWLEQYIEENKQEIKEYCFGMK